MAKIKSSEEIEDIYQRMLKEDKENISKEEAFSVKDEGSALWVANLLMQKKSEADEKILALSEQKKLFLDKINELNKVVSKFNKEEEQIYSEMESNTKYFAEMLKSYVLEKKNADEKYKFNHPFVKVSFSPRKKTYKYANDSDIIKFIEENDLGLIKIKKSFDKNEIKKIIEIDNGITTINGIETDLIRVEIPERTSIIKVCGIDD